MNINILIFKLINIMPKTTIFEIPEKYIGGSNPGSNPTFITSTQKKRKNLRKKKER